ncbi:Cationic amino acid transporter, C-terminal,Amino acid/polyamine transporter I [Cinara cedri]|uniref:Cationic amino acid transporter, C-terminal,Amino acid/polyamine transporter I n=1 Tax=Cinara cedri TaxID=506608 RepID=A0A5E4NHH3_9HEMI|nr:Cationic amino acid transporter, C-terminal,Amino acid/polyamine transporter I [Cinara cedri]
MPGSRHKILSHVFSGFSEKMGRTKVLDIGPQAETPLKRCLTTFDITLLGIGHMVGAGIYVLIGTVAKEIAGPAIILSFMLAGAASMLAALCYAEFGTRIPKAGSAYVYTYVSVGEFWAFVIGWNIILEHMIGAASVARAWSGFFDSMFDNVIRNTTVSMLGELHETLLGKYPDVFAFFICLIHACILGVGVKTSSYMNSFLTLVNLSVIVVIIGAGYYYGNSDNWSSYGGFMPFKIKGVIMGAATCFYAYVGFDSIATSGEEAKDPAYSIPVATIIAMSVVCTGYVLVSGALTFLVPYWSIHPDAAFPAAFAGLDLHWIKYLVSVGALCGMTTTLLGSLYSLPRCIYAMADDGLIFKFLAKVNKKTQVPLINLAISAFMCALIALLFDLEKLVEFMSIGTLLAYTIVSASVVILRYQPTNRGLVRDSSSLLEIPTSQADSFEMDMGGRLKPSYKCIDWIFGDLEAGTAVCMAMACFTNSTIILCVYIQYWFNIDNINWVDIVVITLLAIDLVGCIILIEAHEQNSTELPFMVPHVPLIPALSIVCNIVLMTNLNLLTWIRFLIWMVIGILIYFLYGIHHSKENDVTSYSVLLSSSEAGKTWGAINKSKQKRQKTEDDRKPIIDNEELPENGYYH